MQEYIIDQLKPLAVPIDSVKADPQNARLHNEANKKAIKKSIEGFLQRKPIVVNKNTGIIEAGNGLYQEMKDLGATEIAAVFVDDDDNQAKAFAIMDNRSGELSEWDLPNLKDILQELDSGALDMDLTGFNEDELEDMMTQFHIDDESLTDAIVSEQEYDEAHDRSERILRRMTDKINDISISNPRALNGAIAVIVDIAKGNQILFLADPKLNDLVTEIRRHVEDGTASPMEHALYETINRNNK